MLDINTSKAKRPKAVMTTVNSPYSLSAFESMPSGCYKVYNKDQYIFEKYNQQIVSYCLTTSSIYMEGMVLIYYIKNQGEFGIWTYTKRYRVK